MALFANEQEVYEHLGRLFVQTLADPELAAQLQRADTIVCYRLRDPAAEITLDVRAGVEPRVMLGEGAESAVVVLDMDADTAHRMFLGDVNLTVALARRQIIPDGPLGTVLQLIPLTKRVFPRYRESLVADGRPDLATA